MQEMRAPSLDWEDPLEKEMATHSGIHAWRIPWTEEPGQLQSVGLKELDTTERLRVSLSFTTKIEAAIVKIYNNVYTIDKYVKVIEP